MISQNAVNKVHELRSKGMPFRAIAKELKLKPHTVQYTFYRRKPTAVRSIYQAPAFTTVVETRFNADLKDAVVQVFDSSMSDKNKAAIIRALVRP